MAYLFTTLCLSEPIKQNQTNVNQNNKLFKFCIVLPSQCMVDISPHHYTHENVKKIEQLSEKKHIEYTSFIKTCYRIKYAVCICI